MLFDIEMKMMYFGVPENNNAYKKRKQFFSA